MSATPPRFMTLAEVERASTYGRHAIAAKVDRAEFPAPVKLGSGRNGRIGWLVTDWEAWVEERRAVSRVTASCAMEPSCR